MERLPHQAVLFLPGVLLEGVFRTEKLPKGVIVRMGGRALANPEEEAGEGIFSLWPKTDREGKLLEVQVATRLRKPYTGPEVVAQGVLIRIDREKLTLLITPKATEPFPITFVRGQNFTARLESKKPYRVEGRLEGNRLVAERAWPLEKYLAAKQNSAAKQKGEPRLAIAGRGDPYLAMERAVRPGKEGTAHDLGRPPALKRGQLMGIAGTGPFYLVLLPQVVPQWWPKVEARLSELTRRYEVRFYPDGSRAVVCGDLEALKVWYKRVLKG